MARIKHDGLKYWRVIRRWAMLQYKISMPDLEMILFLYSEKRFGRADFDEYNQIFSWDDKRFQSMVTNGRIVKFRNQRGNKKALYQLSRNSTGMCKSIYQKLNGEETFSEHRTRIFQDGAGYSDRQYRKIMIKINKEIRKMQGLD
jgi:hypothetical protein